MVKFKRPGSQISAGATPRVSLLPTAQRTALKHERTMPKLLLMIVGSAAIAALITGAGFATAVVAQQKLDTLDAESNALVTQLAEFGEVQQLMSRSASLEALRTQATGDEVLFIDLRDEISRGLPAGSALIGFAATVGAVDPAAPEQATLCGTGAAKLTLTIRSPRFTEAADLMDSLSEVTGYECAMATAGAAEAGTVPVEGEDPVAGTVTTTIELTVSEAARSTRFVTTKASE